MSSKGNETQREATPGHHNGEEEDLLGVPYAAVVVDVRAILPDLLKEQPESGPQRLTSQSEKEFPHPGPSTSRLPPSVGVSEAVRRLSEVLTGNLHRSRVAD